ncbi:MAG TPA: alkaline phosphatase D family protein [Solirubrobacterales bacterium]|nr:alkaline phosphatase D family protein [Solirubrobacterales bacterium]
MAQLVLGPLLRYVGEREAVIWVETDEACEVEVLGHRERTFRVHGHDYCLVVIDGLEPGREYEYEVALDGERRWPEPDSEFPPSVIRTVNGDEPLRLSFGSCRVSLPAHPPYTLPKDVHSDGREFDALRTLAHEMRDGARERWPHALLLLGDQVYADEVSLETRAFIRKRRDISNPPGEEVADFEEYARLYQESWADPAIRWLYSTVSCSMVIDDHDVHDDWNISAAWVDEMAEHEWWAVRETAAIASYWLYQYIGNLSPGRLRESRLLEEVRSAEDGWRVLERFAEKERFRRDGERWSYCRDFGGTRLIVIESRCGRVLEEGRRSILDEEEWDWLRDHLSGDYEHVLIGSSDPLLLAPGLHWVEHWGEAIAGGAWGPRGARLGERLRRTLDLDHWAAFGDSFERMMGLLADCGAGRLGAAPAAVTMLSGDVHHAYLAEVAFPRSAGVKSHVWQAVCSPFRNALNRHERFIVHAGNTRAGALLGRGLAQLAGVAREPVRWRLVEGPFYDNQVATLELEGPRARVRLERTVGEPEEDQRRLHTSFDRPLTG